MEACLLVSVGGGLVVSSWFGSRDLHCVWLTELTANETKHTAGQTVSDVELGKES